MSFTWRRPENATYPAIWHKFQAKDTENDEMVTYRVQDLKEEDFQIAIDHMIKFFMHDEPTCNSLEAYKYPDAIDDIVQVWKMMLAQKVVIACYKETTEELVGLNFVGVVLKNEKSDASSMKSKQMKMTLTALDHATSKCDPFEKYNVDKYMTALGLSVDTKYRGRKIGLEILKARKAVGKACGIPLTCTVFTAIASQVLAERAGFVLDSEITYEELSKLGCHFPNVKTKSMKNMSMRLM